MKKIIILMASTRKNRVGVIVANWVERIASDYKEFSFELVDLSQFPLPLLDSEVSPVAGTSAAQLISAWSEKIGSADGYLIISPEYNHGYSGSLKNALDSLKDEWAWKPVGIVGYGGLAGGARSLEQLRLVLIELKMRPTYSAVLLPMAWDAFDEKGEPKHGGATTQLEGLLSELHKMVATPPSALE